MLSDIVLLYVQFTYTHKEKKKLKPIWSRQFSSNLKMNIILKSNKKTTHQPMTLNRSFKRHQNHLNFRAINVY